MESMGLTHKDIKGDNVKFDKKTGRAVLIDMGVAQEFGGNTNPKAFWTIAPPEHFVSQAVKKKAVYKDKVVTSLWDSFSVGKMLFEEMEREGLTGQEEWEIYKKKKDELDKAVERGEMSEEAARKILAESKFLPDTQKYMFASGLEPMKGTSLEIAAENPNTRNQKHRKAMQGAKASVKRKGESDFEALKDETGEYVGIALRKGDEEEVGDAGKFGVMSSYVDFMNRLTHPDPKQRLSPSEALKHPFMRDSILSEEAIKKSLGIKEEPPKPKDEGKKVKAGGVDDKGKGEEVEETSSSQSSQQSYEPLTGTSTTSKGDGDSYDPFVDKMPSSQKKTSSGDDPRVSSSEESEVENEERPSGQDAYDPFSETTSKSKSDGDSYDPFVDKMPSSQKKTSSDDDPRVSSSEKSEEEIEERPSGNDAYDPFSEITSKSKSDGDSYDSFVDKMPSSQKKTSSDDDPRVSSSEKSEEEIEERPSGKDAYDPFSEITSKSKSGEDSYDPLTEDKSSSKTKTSTYDPLVSSSETSEDESDEDPSKKNAYDPLV